MRPTLTLLLCLLPAAAEAQWTVATFIGGNSTRPSTITVDLPQRETSLEFLDVHFDAHPLSSPQYYGARLARFFGSKGFGLEAEFLHIKVYARTADDVHVRGTFEGDALDTTMPMDAIVYRYNHTHGLNFLFANLVWRKPLGSATPANAMLVFRAGAGPVRPGVDVVMIDLNVQGYQFAGYGGQVTAGTELRVYKRLYAMVEYKLTYASPRIDLEGGEGHMTDLTHNIAAGIAVAIGKQR